MHNTYVNVQMSNIGIFITYTVLVVQDDSKLVISSACVDVIEDYKTSYIQQQFSQFVCEIRLLNNHSLHYVV